MKKNLNSVLINKQATLREALETIDRGAIRIALVVDESNKLLAMISDGDIRRAILKGAELNDTVSHFLDRPMITAEMGTPRDELALKMQEKDILCIPLLKNGEVIDIQTLHDSLIPETKNNAVFIMAGGFGTRLRPLTDNCPKPMLKVGGTPILEIQIKNFKKHGFNKFYISTHYLPEMIMDYFGDGSDFGVSITYVHEEQPLGTGGALGLLPIDEINESLVLINGDILTDTDFENLLDFHNEHSANATMGVREYEYQIPFGVVEGDGLKVCGLTEKPTKRYFVNAGIYVISPTVIKSVSKNQYIDMPTLLEKQMEIGRSLYKFPIHEYWLDIGRMDDFQRAQLAVQSMDVD